MTVWGYVRVSTDEQAGSGLGLDAQHAALDREADRRSWTLEHVEDAGWSAKDLRRPGISRILDDIRPGDVVVVAKLDRLSRSVSDFAALAERAKRQGWSIVALDLGIDMTTPMGEMMATIMAAMAQWERRIIGERTHLALAVKKRDGARLGAPVRLPQRVRRRIVVWRKSGLTLAAIAARLTADEVPTVRGGPRWWPSTVRAVLRSVDCDAEAAQAAAAAAANRAVAA